MENAVESAAELNPYANIRLERKYSAESDVGDVCMMLTAADALAPLTAATDLASHPTLSKPFVSKTLTDLVDHSCGLMRKENQSLWEVRQLWTSLYGDNTWLPCELMIGEGDTGLYTEDQVARRLEAISAKSASATVNGEGSADQAQANGTAKTNGDANDGDISMTEAEATSDKPAGKDSGKADESTDKDAEKAPTENKKDATEKQADDGDGADKTAAEAKEDEDEDEEDTFVHPLFLPPSSSRPDRDLGLPASEADDIRRLLALYVQKQEEVCRGTYKLHRGLLKAQRLRGDVLHWSKAEAHCGPNRDMSDGEDWYDKEEWGLDEDLKKGQDEEEEDTTTQGKKTRARR